MRTLNIKLKSSDDKSFLLHSLNADVVAHVVVAVVVVASKKCFKL